LLEEKPSMHRLHANDSAKRNRQNGIFAHAVTVTFNLSNLKADQFIIVIIIIAGMPLTGA